jgi:hypothetical protein
VCFYGLTDASEADLSAQLYRLFRVVAARRFADRTAAAFAGHSPR